MAFLAMAKAYHPTRLRPDADPELRAVYDGEDLPLVAERWGMTIEEAVAVHAGSELRAAFCGFAPGFSYLAVQDFSSVLAPGYQPPKEGLFARIKRTLRGDRSPV